MSRVVPLFSALVLACGCARPESPPGTTREVDPATIRTTAGDGSRTLPVAPHPRPAGTPFVSDLLNEDPGLDTNIEAALPELNRLDQKTIDTLPNPDPLGLPGLVTPGGLDDPPMPITPGFPGRRGATKSKLLKDNGGNEASEKAVAAGLAWLAKQQKADGSWVYDGAEKDEVTAATGMALLAFLGSGEAHLGKGKYTKTVKEGLNWLLRNLPVNGRDAGKFAKAGNMYAQAIGTLALVEAYGMTQDKTLLAPARAAVNYIHSAQAPNGSWGYSAATPGDTSITGWQVQALHAAAMSKDIVVVPQVTKRAIGFLDGVSAGPRKAVYGYTDSARAQPGTSLTAVGLWCRYHIDKWGPDHAGMAEGVTGLMAKAPGGTTKKPRANKPALDVYFYYYATQVVAKFGGDEWKDWNEGPKAADGTRKGGMRDWLVELQVKKEGQDQGSWDPDGGYIGRSCGRLGTTAMCVLTLEVYYRHLPLHKRKPGDAPKIEGK